MRMSQVLEKHYLGKVCCRCEQNLRYVSNDKCVTCSVNYWKEYRKQDDYRQRENARARNFFKQNPDKRREKNRKYCEKYPEIYSIKNSRRKARLLEVAVLPYTPQQLQDRLSLFNNCCTYCFERENLTVDHFIPINNGGADALYNLVPACRSCNSSKGAKNPVVWMRSRGITEDRIQVLLQLIQLEKIKL